MRRFSWGTLFLLALLAGLLFLIVGSQVAQHREGGNRTIVHEIRQMIATLQTPLEADNRLLGVPRQGFRVPLPAGIAALTALLLLALGVRFAAQHRSRSRRS